MDDATARRRGDRRRAVARGTGELLVTAGLVLLLFVVYELFVTDLLTGRRQAELTEQIRDEWGSADSTPRAQVPGDAIALLHIPRFGADYQQVVLEGALEEQLSQGPGHYPGTAMPGELGNVALAGHRVGKGSPFLDLDQLRPGDPVVLETRDSWFVYRMLPLTGDPSGIPGQEIVAPSDVEVIAPVPNSPGAEPTAAYLTLTTCHPRFSARQRLIVHAVLDGEPVAKAAAPDGPPALTEG